ncbi:MAG: Na+/H+ antiporter [Bacteroidetes bacterium]|nr:Na+/H+ antiporter [Bacteroidota bacterium]
MENYSIIMLILGVMMALSAFADKLKKPYPVLLVTAGIALGFVPGMPLITISPEIVFLIFLPPMLYDAACNINGSSLPGVLRYWHIFSWGCHGR